MDRSSRPPTLGPGQAAARLRHLVELQGIGLITGEPGSGKTTSCRKLIDGLHDGLYRVFYVPLSTGNIMYAYKSIAWEMGLPTERSRAACYRVIRSEVTRLCVETKKTPILIVDEAHHLRNEVLEDLRLLTNQELDSVNRLCLLLVGLVEIRRRLSMAVREVTVHRQFAHRVARCDSPRMRRLDTELQKEIDSAAAAIVEASYAAAIAAVNEAFGRPPPAGSPRRSRAQSAAGTPRRRSSVRRDCAAVEGLAEGLFEAIKANPGQGMSVLASGLGNTPRGLQVAVARLKAQGRIRTTGQRQLTRYFPLIPSEEPE